MTTLDSWVIDILADPITKIPVQPDHFPEKTGVIDARVFLCNTYGYDSWAEGQFEYEQWADKDSSSVDAYKKEITYDRPIYEYFVMRGHILDCGGGAGTVREFLPDDVQFVSTDPWLQAPIASSKARRDAYTCLSKPINFIGATAEFQPFVSECFDWVHMRSMLDHVQVVDLALLEARRVLKSGGRVLIGLYVEGGKSGIIPLERRVKNLVKVGLESIGIDRWKDHHVWHPTYATLTKLIQDNGFRIEDTYWQPQWKNTVCYISGIKS